MVGYYLLASSARSRTTVKADIGAIGELEIFLYKGKRRQAARPTTVPDLCLLAHHALRVAECVVEYGGTDQTRS